MTILLLRHGETEWNLERRYQGRFDSPLTGRGTAQALAIGRLLAMVPEAASAPIVASPQGRARRTAEIILEQRGAAGELHLDDRLRELSLGSWDGLTYADVAKALARYLRRRRALRLVLSFARRRELRDVCRTGRRLAGRVGATLFNRRCRTRARHPSSARSLHRFTAGCRADPAGSARSDLSSIRRRNRRACGSG